MSTDPWAAYQAARASAATTDAYRQFVQTVREVLGYEHIVRTHQGRAAKHILSQVLIKSGQVVPGNMYCTTTKLHQEMAGAVFVDVIVDQAHDPTSDYSQTGQNFRPSLELVRLTIPRRVFTDDHMHVVAEGLIRLQQRRESIRGLRFVYEPPKLRLFRARFEPVL